VAVLQAAIDHMCRCRFSVARFCDRAGL